MATAIMIVATTVVTTLTALVLAWRFLYPRRPLVIQSPLAEVVSGRKPSAVEELEYHPDEFPGARDVDTPVSFRSSFWFLSFSLFFFFFFPLSPASSSFFFLSSFHSYIKYYTSRNLPTYLLTYIPT